MKNNTCKPRCNQAREFFNFGTKQCQYCPNPSYPDQARQRCAPCDKMCGDCSLSFDGTVTCNKCATGAYQDYLGRCRLGCNATSYFDFTVNKCVLCPAGTYLEKEYLECQPCPNSNCTTCS